MKYQEIIDKLTLEEKASLCSGKDFWHTKGIERLDIPSVMLTAITPPINANGRFSNITAACVKFLNCAKSKRYITRIENIDITRRV